MTRIALAIALALSLSACAPESDDAKSAPVAVVKPPLENPQDSTYDRAVEQHLAEEARRTEALAAGPAGQPTTSPQNPLRVSALDSLRIDTTTAETMAESLRTFGQSSTPEEEGMVQQALLIAMLSAQEAMTVEAASGANIRLDDTTVFRRTFGPLHGKTYRTIYNEMLPLLPKYREAFLRSRWANGQAPR